jgi:hypothetical protein
MSDAAQHRILLARLCPAWRRTYSCSKGPHAPTERHSVISQKTASTEEMLRDRRISRHSCHTVSCGVLSSVQVDRKNGELHDLYCPINFFFLWPNWGLGRPIVKVSRSHTQAAGLLWTSDQPVAETATYTARNKHEKQMSMPSAEFEPGFPAIKRLQTYALDHTATGIAINDCYWPI